MLPELFSPRRWVTYGRLNRAVSSGLLQFTMIEILSFGRTVISRAGAIAPPSADALSWKYVIWVGVEHEPSSRSAHTAL